QADGADRDRLDHARMSAADIDDVADRERVFKQDEEAGDDVLDQGLRAEADRDAGNARARKQRRDVDAELGKHDQADQDEKNDEYRSAQQRQQRARPGAARQRLAVAAEAVEVALHRRAEELPNEERHQQNGGDRQHAAGDLSPDLGTEPGEGIEAPGLQQRQRSEDIDHHRCRDGQQRHVAVGALLKGREATLQIIADGEAALTHPPYTTDDDAGRDDDHEAEQRGAEHEGESGLDAQHISTEGAGDIEYSEHVPRVGQAMAQHAPAMPFHDLAAAAVLPAQNLAHGRAVLQHEDYREDAENQHRPAQQQGINCARDAHPPGTGGKRQAINRPIGEASDPDVEVVARLVAERIERA